MRCLAFKVNRDYAYYKTPSFSTWMKQKSKYRYATTSNEKEKEKQKQNRARDDVQISEVRLIRLLKFKNDVSMQRMCQASRVTPQWTPGNITLVSFTNHSVLENTSSTLEVDRRGTHNDV